MSGTPEFDINYVAKLARLDLSAEEQERYNQQLGKILDYFQMLNEVDTSGVDITAHAVPLFDVMREDLPGDTLSQELALANAPKSAEGQIVVPRVVE
jgi:aspartyl-tRNA(Asn)/glutamyl-tRNA(Gln) amidotransferase subunit C